MDFVQDQMLDGRAFRVLTVIDLRSRESVSLEVNFRLTARCVGKAFDEAALARGWLKAITVDNSTEFTAKALGRLGLAAQREARLHTARKADGQRADQVVQRSAAR